MANRFRPGACFKFCPTGEDAISPPRNVRKGDKVCVVELPGAPPPGAMGLVPVAKRGKIVGVVSSRSLCEEVPAGKLDAVSSDFYGLKRRKGLAGRTRGKTNRRIEVTAVPFRLEPFATGDRASKYLGRALPCTGWTTKKFATSEDAANFVADWPEASMPCWNQWTIHEGRLVRKNQKRG